jgi:hypothetical protein
MWPATTAWLCASMCSTAMRAPFDALVAEKVERSGQVSRVAELGIDGDIEGILPAQPSRVTPDEFISWNHTTGNGTFGGTYDAQSPYVYVAALSVSPKGSGEGATDLLLAKAVGKGLREGRSIEFFSARIPRYHRFSDKMTALLRRAWHETSSNCRECVSEDWESCGYGVVYTFPPPFVGWPFPAWGPGYSKSLLGAHTCLHTQ